MIEFIKKTKTGKRIIRFSKKPALGWIVRITARVLQSEAINFEHFRPSHLQHNKQQNQTLSTFAARSVAPK